MTRCTARSESGLSYSQRLAIFERELTVVAILLADMLDKRAATEAEWQRVTTALHRIRALQEV